MGAIPQAAENEGCEHQSARQEHRDMHGTEVEVFVSCPDCGGYWTIHYDLEDLTADIQLEEGER